jgi:hypothetical protein
MINKRDISGNQQSTITKIARIVSPILIAILGLFLFHKFIGVKAAGTLEVTINASYNLVVDSNASSPSTYAPSVATVMGEFCNTGDDILTDVWGYIGDYASGTPGQYPQLDSSTDLPSTHPLYDTGTYYFTHMGGATSLSDASRYIGDLAAQQCVTQYWHFSYPQCSESDRTPPCSDLPLWGDSVKPDDDLSLNFDIWGTANDGSGDIDDVQNWTMTMRNEISALANKIEPNPNGRWFNTDADTVRPGEVITSNGILYELGNINKGFDNDGDFAYDYNAWMQPIGDTSYDPSCFRLIRTSGVLTVSRSSKPDLIIPFTDQLYFSNLPEDNNGVVGNVYYTFMALGGPCSSQLTPYQEVASGADNEKFNGDYGIGIPPLTSLGPLVTIDKASQPSIVSLGDSITYTVPFVNQDAVYPAGLTMATGGVNMPLVFSDTIPVGTAYVGGTADCSIDSAAICEATILYSIDSGATWSETDPGYVTSTSPDHLVMIQWWLDEPLPASTEGYATFQTEVPGGYSGSRFIENCASAHFGSGMAFDEACITTIVRGTNTIEGFVWRDEDLDGIKDGGAETGISTVDVQLFWDKDGDGFFDPDIDVLISTTTTSADPDPNYTFTDLPDGDYIVVIDEKANVSAGNLPEGYRHTTETEIAVTGLSSSTTPGRADFGFGPSLEVNKAMVGGQGYEGQQVTYSIAVRNLRPGGGTEVNGLCTYDVWSSGQDVLHSLTQKNKLWQYEANVYGPPDGAYAVTELANADDQMAVTGFNLPPQAGNIQTVTLVIYADETGILDASDELQVTLYFGDSASTPVVVQTGTDFDGSPGAVDIFLDDVTANNSAGWDWTDFASDYIDVVLVGDKGSGSFEMAVDAVGLQITTDTACPISSVDDTLLTVPLTDTYDTTYLEFVSAVPAESDHQSSSGLITWDDVGPIGAGQSAIVQATFLVKDLGDAVRTVLNDAGSTDAKFGDGTESNDDYTNAAGTLYPTGFISGTVWSDIDDDGWQNPNGPDATDAYVSGISVELYECVGYTEPPNENNTCTANSGSWLLVDTKITDSNGDYAFENLPEGYYYVAINTGTLPSGVIQTGDPDDTPGKCDPSGGNATCDDQWKDPGDKLSDVELGFDTGETHEFPNINFGYTNVPISVYGVIWEDVDGNATRDGGDNGIENVTVYLCTETPCDSSNAVASTTTNADGRYIFDSGLTNGETYYIGVEHTTAPLGAEWSNTIDPDEQPGDHQYETGVTVSTGTTYGSFDFGYHQNGSTSISGTVYNDWDGDGTRDLTTGTGLEGGIPSITVYLYEDSNGDGSIDSSTDALLTSTVTDANGDYNFAGLPAGSYIVLVDEADADMPSTHYQTGDPDETGGTCTVCDADGSADTTSGDVSNVDFGYQPTGFSSIGDFVWMDDDGDGIQDTGEAGIANISIYLYEDSNNDGVIDSGDALVASTTTSDGTDGNPIGYYLFAKIPYNLAGGDYLVDIDTADTDLPPGYVLSTGNDPHDVAITGSDDYLDADFGFTPTGRIGDLIWLDSDGNGTFDPTSESGIDNVIVQLFTWTDSDLDGLFDIGEESVAPVGTTTSDSSGMYTFTNLAVGSYVVKVDTGSLPSGWSDFTQTGDPDARDVPCSDTDPLAELRCNSYSAAEISAGQIDLTHDFGFQPHGSIGDFVWFDVDGDGEQDATEQGIEDIVVTLTPPAGIDVGGGASQPVTTTTDSNGFYSFGALPMADGYQISISYTSAYTPTYDADDGGSSPDSNVIFDISSNGSATWGGVQSCSDSDRGCNMDFDFGLQYNGIFSISGHVFYDDGGVGDGTIGEQFIPGTDSPYENVTVYLWNGGTLLGTTTTDANGQYTFTNLVNGDYTISVNPNSPQLSGLDLTASPSGTTSDLVSINNADVTGEDFGFHSNIDFGDLVDSFGTLLSNEGAGHILGDLYLGTASDPEIDGQPHALALGDDQDAQGDDDDGITRYGDWSPGTTGASFFVNVNGDNGYLVAFFDWDGDGQFASSGETIVFGDVTNGRNYFTVDIPVTSVNFLNTRFRLYDKDEIAYIASTGLTTNGEVEDYQWDLGEPTAVTLAYFEAIRNFSGALLMWETILEINVFGYNVYRTTAPSLPADAQPLNPVLIPSQIGVLGNRFYEYSDPQIEPNTTYYYWLEHIGLDGSQIIGPRELTQSLIYLPLVSR